VIETGEIMTITSRDYWFKVVDFLQQNWALIDPIAGGVKVCFFGDTSGVFDELMFSSETEARDALLRNGLRRYAADERAQGFLAAPEPPFHRRPHPNGPIYSSGRYWN
jgi:hypothetical protein